MFEAMPYDEEKYQRAKKHWDELAKPLHGMGLFEELISRIEGMPNAGGLKKRCVLVFCADNGVVEEGVTQTGSEVTATVAEDMARGDATVCIMAKAAGADVFPSHILALTSPEMSHSVMSRYLLPLEEVRCAAARTSRKPSNA